MEPLAVSVSAILLGSAFSITVVIVTFWLLDRYIPRGEPAETCPSGGEPEP